jgi:hypothetical protein
MEDTMPRKNPEDRAAYQKRWYDQNKERQAATNKKWRAANPEKKAANSKKWNDENPEKQAASVKQWSARNPHRWVANQGVDVTAEWYFENYDLQEGKCKICSEFQHRLSIDHCHTTMKLRGLICGPCNRALGLMRDNPEALRNAARYLEG